MCQPSPTELGVPQGTKAGVSQGKSSKALACSDRDEEQIMKALQAIHTRREDKRPY